MNKYKLLQDLSIISPNWAVKINRFLRKNEMDKIANTNCYVSYFDSMNPNQRLELKDYTCCIVGEAFNFPSGIGFISRDQAERNYANCVDCKYYSNGLYATLSLNKKTNQININRFWNQLQGFIFHFKHHHLDRYHTKLMQMYIKKLEIKIKQNEKLLVVK